MKNKNVKDEKKEKKGLTVLSELPLIQRFSLTISRSPEQIRNDCRLHCKLHDKYDMPDWKESLEEYMKERTEN